MSDREYTYPISESERLLINLAAPGLDWKLSHRAEIGNYDARLFIKISESPLFNLYIQKINSRGPDPTPVFEVGLGYYEGYDYWDGQDYEFASNPDPIQAVQDGLRAIASYYQARSEQFDKFVNLINANANR